VTRLEEETLPGPPVVWRVESSRHWHSLVDGLLFHRSGTVNRVLRGLELYSLFHVRPSGATEVRGYCGD